MNDPPQLLRPTRHISSHSPTRLRTHDDILAHLAPPSAVDALGSATGALRDCLNGASAAEREFAMRTALASQQIWEWVGELSEWNWPSEGGSTGFEAPGGTRRKLFVQVTGPKEDENEYSGSVPKRDVVRYERRIEEVYHAMSELEVEDIKKHVLTNHIMPLSRPTTPLSDAGRSTASSSPNYNRMDDLTAVITAIVVQTLPNLAKLSRLLQIWSVRLNVLQQIQPLLLALDDAEIALQSGWNAITVKTKSDSVQQQESGQSGEPRLKRADFEVMRKVLEKKVIKPGRRLDYMLDCLEGQHDTLPDQWIDRMDAVERGYGDWVAVCERKMRETDWTRSSHASSLESRPVSPDRSPDEQSDGAPESKGLGAVDLPAPQESGDFEEPSKERRDAQANEAPAGLQESLMPESSFISESERSEIGDQSFSSFDGTKDTISSALVQPPTPIIEEPEEDHWDSRHTRWDAQDNICSPDEETGPLEDCDELDLPPLREGSRRGSDASQNTTVVHEASSEFGDLSDMPEVSASPAVPRDRIREAEYVGESPSSSPPESPGTHESSAAPLDSPPMTPIDEDGKAPMKSTLDDSFQEEFDDSMSISEITSPTEHRGSLGDQQLRQQLSDIIDSIPAKIKLANETPTINLNPPDLQLPRIRKRPSKEPVKRSMSSMSNMSSRTATPSFTLSPAKTRTRQNRGQQEIKVYHLSRSTGEAPIKLFIRCVGESGERVMVRVGGGWADLSEYLKDYASHHGRRSGGAGKAKVEVRDLPRVSSRGPDTGSSPPNRPASALELSPSTPLNLRKTRRSMGAATGEVPRLRPKTPAAAMRQADDSVVSEDQTPPRSSSRLSWVEEDSSFLGLAGPSGKQVEMSEENKAWVESVKEKVRLASGERKVSAPNEDLRRFGEIGRVGGTKRLFRRGENGKETKK